MINGFDGGMMDGWGVFSWLWMSALLLFWGRLLAEMVWAMARILPGRGAGGGGHPEIRVREGDTLRVRVRNDLPADTTIHWHGLPIKNDMDGAPGVTQEPIGPARSSWCR